MNEKDNNKTITPEQIESWKRNGATYFVSPSAIRWLI